jgi:hypothetical protein
MTTPITPTVALGLVVAALTCAKESKKEMPTTGISRRSIRRS